MKRLCEIKIRTARSRGPREKHPCVWSVDKHAAALLPVSRNDRPQDRCTRLRTTALGIEHFGLQRCTGVPIEKLCASNLKQQFVNEARLLRKPVRPHRPALLHGKFIGHVRAHSPRRLWRCSSYEWIVRKEIVHVPPPKN
jgi:hypothetical protein